ncbi:hypothetical protein KSF78_0003217 [Schistosoma japonicum]|nr:hypothetical protein KSF78_0003217 [Schistosoma japonicum]
MKINVNPNININHIYINININPNQNTTVETVDKIRKFQTNKVNNQNRKDDYGLPLSSTIIRIILSNTKTDCRNIKIQINATLENRLTYNYTQLPFLFIKVNNCTKLLKLIR